MEERIRRYERYIKREARKVREGDSGGFERRGDEIFREERRERLIRLHEDMILSFQHERLVHLLIMLFFVFITVGLLFLTIFGVVSGVLIGGVLYCLLILDFIMAVLSGAYVKHYYFLENHVQGLYGYFSELLR